MNAALAKHLNLAEELIQEVQVWAQVLWVRVRGMRPRFVSKKVSIMTPEELVERLQSHGFDASRWQKHGKDRIYLNKIPGHGKSSAFLEVSEDGFKMGAYFCPLSLDEILKIAQTPGQTSAKPKDCRDETTKALDKIYGAGNWDRWDREDYEG